MSERELEQTGEASRRIPATVGYSQTGRNERLVATHVWPAMMIATAANAGHLDSGSVERCHEGTTSPLDVPARGWARDGLSAIKRPGSGTHRKGRAPFAVPLP